MEIKKIDLTSTLLLVKQSSNPNHTFAWVGTINDTSNKWSNKINVLLFNCDSLLGIVPILQKDFETLVQCEQTDNVKNQIAYIEDLMKMLADPAYYKQADEDVLRLVSNDVMKSLVTNQDVIYLSGVKDIW